MRYLSYYNNDWKNAIELELNHPDYLVSLSTESVKISNMNKCVNLKNLSSLDNTYKRDDIVPLNNLRRIYSFNNKYEQNGNCLIQDLFENNKLEYVFVYNISSDPNIVKSFVIRENIENLRFMFVDYNEIYDIKLNIS